MKQLTAFFSFILFIFSWNCQAQEDETSTAQDTTYWKNSLKMGFNFNQAAFSDNWTAGGVSSIAFGSIVNAAAHYEKGKITFNNELEMQYGIVNNQGQGFRKSQDRLLLDSKVGYKLSDKWNGFFSMNFLSQFDRGFEFGEDANGEEQRTLISKFVNPAFLTFAMGFEYKPVDYFWVRISPFSPRFTFVTDTTLYLNVPTNYGVEIGKRVRQEWAAASILANFDKDLAENLNLKARYSLFANFENFAGETIDHRLDLTLTAKITKIINVNLTGILLYDKDQDKDVQLAQTLALGLGFQLGN